jgi:hypothetical protein
MIFSTVFKEGTLYNYADDNTISYAHSDAQVVKRVLDQECCRLIDWFAVNKMKANPEKFQALAIGTKSRNKHLHFEFKGVTIACEDEVKLLGVTVDYNLKFDSHISTLCKKASRQLNALKRIGKHLNLVQILDLPLVHSIQLQLLPTHMAFLQQVQYSENGKNSGEGSPLHIPRLY